MVMRSEFPTTNDIKWKPRRQTPVAAGHQIRDYVLDQNRVKDLRTGIESTPKAVLNGELDDFIEAALRQRL